jgi:excinuclease ABC subunit A
MPVSEAITFFGSKAEGARIARRLKVLQDVGLGYIRLGQSATSLSGGEAQRVKLAAHLVGSSSGGSTLFLFDEPTTGLHFDDISKLISCFQSLLAAGHSVVIIEHNLDVIKCADHIIDLGPEAGDLGGYLVGAGTPEELAANPSSATGTYLRALLKA